MNFNKGDIVVCLPGFDTSDYGAYKGGSGYKDGKMCAITSDIFSDSIIWPANGGGIHSQAVRLTTEHESKAYHEGIRYLKDVPIPELKYEIF